MNWEFVQEGAGNYLKIVAEEREKFADELFSYQEIPGFLPMEIRRINGKKEAFYDITGKVPLNRYLMEQTVTLSGIRDFLLQILDLEELLGDYLLEDSGLLVHPDFLYIEREKGSVWGIYSGQRTDGNVPAFGALLEFIMGYMNQKDRELVFFIYGMHKLTKGAGCTRGDLKRYVKNGDEGFTPENVERGEKKHPQKLQLKTKERISKHAVSKQNLVLPVLLLAAGILIPVILWRMGFFTMPLSGEMNWGRCLGAFGFFFVVCGYGAWKLMPQREKAGKKTPVRSEEEKEESQLCLIPEKSGDDLIPADQFPFLIGKDLARVDACLDGSGISGVHLEIIQDSGEIYAVDQETPGGTYHNGCRMVAWQKETLRDGDILSIGTHEYVVEITSF